MGPGMTEFHARRQPELQAISVDNLVLLVRQLSQLGNWFVLVEPRKRIQRLRQRRETGIMCG